MNCIGLARQGFYNLQTCELLKCEPSFDWSQAEIHMIGKMVCILIYILIADFQVICSILKNWDMVKCKIECKIRIKNI